MCGHREWRCLLPLLAYRLNVERRERRRFAGAYYNPPRDDRRLRKQIGRVWDVLSDGQPHTYEEIQRATAQMETCPNPGGDPQNSISAQIRHLRKPQHGSWIIDALSRRSTLYHYRMRNPDGTHIPPIMPEAQRPPEAPSEQT